MILRQPNMCTIYLQTVSFITFIVFLCFFTNECFKVWEARQKEDMERKRQEELRIAYEREQDILNNKYVMLPA